MANTAKQSPSKLTDGRSAMTAEANSTCLRSEVRAGSAASTSVERFSCRRWSRLTGKSISLSDAMAWKKRSAIKARAEGGRWSAIQPPPLSPRRAESVHWILEPLSDHDQMQQRVNQIYGGTARSPSSQTWRSQLQLRQEGRMAQTNQTYLPVVVVSRSGSVRNQPRQTSQSNRDSVHACSSSIEDACSSGLIITPMDLSGIKLLSTELDALRAELLHKTRVSTQPPTVSVFCPLPPQTPRTSLSHSYRQRHRVVNGRGSGKQTDDADDEWRNYSSTCSLETQAIVDALEARDECLIDGMNEYTTATETKERQCTNDSQNCVKLPTSAREYERRHDTPRDDQWKAKENANAVNDIDQGWRNDATSGDNVGRIVTPNGMTSVRSDETINCERYNGSADFTSTTEHDADGLSKWLKSPAAPNAHPRSASSYQLAGDDKNPEGMMEPIDAAISTGVVRLDPGNEPAEFDQNALFTYGSGKPVHTQHRKTESDDFTNRDASNQGHTIDVKTVPDKQVAVDGAVMRIGATHLLAVDTAVPATSNSKANAVPVKVSSASKSANCTSNDNDRGTEDKTDSVYQSTDCEQPVYLSDTSPATVIHPATCSRKLKGVDFEVNAKLPLTASPIVEPVEDVVVIGDIASGTGSVILPGSTNKDIRPLPDLTGHQHHQADGHAEVSSNISSLLKDGSSDDKHTIPSSGNRRVSISSYEADFEDDEEDPGLHLHDFQDGCIDEDNV